MERGAEAVDRRGQLGAGRYFTPVLIAPADSPAGTDEGGPPLDTAPAIEVEFAGKVRVRIPGSVPAVLTAAVVKALSRR